MKKLSETSMNIDGQPMFKVLDKVKKLESEGKNIIHFEIGDPDFSTPNNIKNALFDAVSQNFTHYTSSFGLEEFREKIRLATLNSRGFKPDLNQILVTPGANIGIFYSVLCLVDPGCEVIVPDPGFPSYCSTIKMCNAKAIRIPVHEENAFRMQPEDIEEKISDKTRLIVINSPHNPTGSVLTKNELKSIYDIAEKYDVYLYSDEIYARMIYGEKKFHSPSIYDKCKERVIIANSFSKAFAMTGWRLGTLIGPQEVIQRMAMLLETTSSCVSPFIQKAGIEAMMGDQTPVNKMIKEYEKRRDLLVDGLNLINGIKVIKPDGAFYLFANISKTGMNSEELTDYLLDDAGVAVLPGTNFGKYGEGYIRFCYATSQDNIINALERIKTSITKLRC